MFLDCRKLFIVLSTSIFYCIRTGRTGNDGCSNAVLRDFFLAPTSGTLPAQEEP